jgi:nucleoside-diphosphate-sugar epimerase
VRFFGAYGPDEPARKIFTRLIRQFALKRDQRFAIVGDGNNLIDAMYVTDAARALLALLMTPTKLTRNRTIDLCSGSPITIRELVECAGETFGIVPEVTFEGEVPENIRFYSSDQSMSLSYGFAPEVSLVDGLKRLASHLAGTAGF